MWDGNLRNLLRCVTSKSCLNKILAWNLQDEMRLILIWFSMLSKWFCNFFGTSGKSLLWLYASVQLVLFMSETHEQVQLQSQHIYPSVKLCSVQRKCKKPQELHLRLYRPQFFLMLNFITVQLEKMCLIRKDFQEKVSSLYKEHGSRFSKLHLNKQQGFWTDKTRAGMLGSAQHRIWWKSKTAYTNTLH